MVSGCCDVSLSIRLGEGAQNLYVTTNPLYPNLRRKTGKILGSELVEAFCKQAAPWVSEWPE